MENAYLDGDVVTVQARNGNDYKHLLWFVGRDPQAWSQFSTEPASLLDSWTIHTQRSDGSRVVFGMPAYDRLGQNNIGGAYALSFDAEMPEGYRCRATDQCAGTCIDGLCVGPPRDGGPGGEGDAAVVDADAGPGADAGTVDAGPAVDAGGDAGSDAGCDPTEPVFEAPLGVEAVGFSFDADFPEGGRSGVSVAVSAALGSGNALDACGYSMDLDFSGSVCLRAGVEQRCVNLGVEYDGECQYEETCTEPPNLTCDLERFCCQSSVEITAGLSQQWVLGDEIKEEWFNAFEASGQVEVQVGYEVSGGVSYASQEGELCTDTCANGQLKTDIEGELELALFGNAELGLELFGKELAVSGELRGCANAALTNGGGCAESSFSNNLTTNAHLAASAGQLKLCFLELAPHDVIFFSTGDNFECN
jgi:hypothetical protein